MDMARQVAVCEFAQSQRDLNFTQINTMRPNHEAQIKPSDLAVLRKYN